MERDGCKSDSAEGRHDVGVELKWVIGCYWLHEALVRLDRGGAIGWPRLTLDLGYFDQALVIPDFKALTSVTPAAYVRRG